MFDIRKFYEDHGFDYYDGSYSHKHTRPGWVNRPCPFCSGNPGLHLGFNEKEGYFVCYRCGGHSTIEVIKTLLQISWRRSQEIAKAYGGSDGARHKIEREFREQDIEVQFPSGTKDLTESGKAYLRARKFDPDVIADKWNVLSTGHLGDYRFRIIAPIYFRKVLVSYQGRDITGRSDKKYKACPKAEERIHHKHIVYGFDHADKDVIVVEGITDVWRLGYGAVATFGIKFVPAQVKLLSTFRRVFVFFDEVDPEAEAQNAKLTSELTSLGVESCSIKIGLGVDPGDMRQEDADYLMRDLLIRR